MLDLLAQLHPDLAAGLRAIAADPSLLGDGIRAGEGDGIGELRVLGDPADVVVIDAQGVVVPGAGRRVAIVGLHDVVVVDTRDALLVTTREGVPRALSLEVLERDGWVLLATTGEGLHVFRRPE